MLIAIQQRSAAIVDLNKCTGTKRTVRSLGRRDRRAGGRAGGEWEGGLCLAENDSNE